MKKIIYENRAKGNKETSNKTEIKISSSSYGNAMGVECSRILADDIGVEHTLELNMVARDFFIFQSAEDLFNGINNIQNKQYIEEISVIPSYRPDSYHPIELSTSLGDRIHKEIKVGKNVENKIDVKGQEDSKNKAEEENKDNIINDINVIPYNKDNAEGIVNKIDKKDNKMEEQKLNNRQNKNTLTIKRQNRAEINNNNDKLNNTNSLNENKDNILSLH